MKDCCFFFLFCLLCAVVLQSVGAFSPISNRRDFCATALVTTGGLVCSPPAARAVSGPKKVNEKLQAYGLPTLSKIPDGFVPLLEIYGKGKNRAPLLVQFNHPLTWVVTLPSNTVNGEDGTIQAGDYGKGDTATLYVYESAGSVSSISKELAEDVLKKSISQRGDNMYQNFKITKLETSGTSTMVDFKYQLLTGAGFEVDRKGVASITNAGQSVQCLWAASIAARYKKTEDTLRTIVNSFHCYADGLNFSDELLAFD